MTASAAAPATPGAFAPTPGVIAALAKEFPSDPTDDLPIAREELDRLFAGLIPPVGKTTLAPPTDPDPEPRLRKYQFVPQTAIRDRRRLIASMGMKELYSTLEKLSFWRNIDTGRPLPYSDIRLWWCAINLRLNELRADFPALRPNRRPHRPGDEGFTAADTLLLNDRQVIDLEWLRATIPMAPRPKHRWIFDTETWFDFRAAERFVALVGSIDSKIEDLHMSEDAQFACMALCSDRVKKRRESVLQRTELLEAKLVARASRKRSRLDLSAVGSWKKDFIALAMAEGSPSEAAQTFRILFGVPSDQRHMANRKRGLDQIGFPVIGAARGR